MNGDAVPKTDHILRYIRPGYVQTDDAGQCVILGGFLARESDDHKPSVNWLEVFDGTTEGRVAEVRSRRRLEYAASGRLARANVEQVLAILQVRPWEDRNVIHAPLSATEVYPCDPSHSVMTHIPTEAEAELTDDALDDMLARCVLDNFPARE